MTNRLSDLLIWMEAGKGGENSGRADQSGKQSWRDALREERTGLQLRGNRFQDVPPFDLFLSASDKLGQTGEEEERGDEKKEVKKRGTDPFSRGFS